MATGSAEEVLRGRDRILTNVMSTEKPIGQVVQRAMLSTIAKLKIGE